MVEEAKRRFAEIQARPRDTHFYPLPSRPHLGAPADLHASGGTGSLYIHVPYCMDRCTYCFFVTQTGLGADDMRRYVIAELAAEVRMQDVGLRRYAFTSCYYGGGTPGILPPESFLELHGLLAPYLAPDVTVTLETHPNFADAKRIEAWRASGIDRVSVGIQTLDHELLGLINRPRQEAEALPAISRLLEAGFKDVNADVLYGLPNQDLGSWERTLDELIATDIPSLSVYVTTYVPDTRSAFARLGVAPPPAALTRDMYHLAWEKLNAAGYLQSRYGCSTFSRIPYRYGLNVHRQHVLEGLPMVGLGMGAYGSIPNYTYMNFRTRPDYRKAIELGRPPIMVATPVTTDERPHKYAVETWKTGFLSCDAYEKQFGERPERRFSAELEALIALGELESVESEYRLTRQGAGRAHIISDMFMSQAARSAMEARRAAAQRSPA